MNINEELVKIVAKLDNIQSIAENYLELEHRVSILEQEKAFLRGILAIGAILLPALGMILWYILTRGL